MRKIDNWFKKKTKLIKKNKNFYKIIQFIKTNCIEMRILSLNTNNKTD